MSPARRGPAGDFDYDTHGSGYARHRRSDPRIDAHIRRALGPARTVLNVGAGAGSYEPDDRYVIAVEPSAAVRAQRPPARPAVDGAAEGLPFDSDSFDAAMTTLSVHQWHDLNAGPRELRRVSRGPVLVVTFDGEALARFWLGEYVPEVIAIERRRFPPIGRITAALGGRSDVIEVPVPLDYTDGFGEAYYERHGDLRRQPQRVGALRLVVAHPR